MEGFKIVQVCAWYNVRRILNDNDEEASSLIRSFVEYISLISIYNSWSDEPTTPKFVASALTVCYTIKAGRTTVYSPIYQFTSN